MSNFLPPEKLRELHELRSAGNGIRKLSRMLGISTVTIRRYIKDDDGTKCACGDPVGHKGWCRARFAKSIARQAIHARRSGKIIHVPPAPIRRSRVTEAIAEKWRWLGLADYAPPPLQSRAEQWAAVVAVYRVIGRRHSDFWDDVRQEMILACLDGRLPLEDVGRARSTFVSFVWRGNTWRCVEVEMGEHLAGPGRGLAA